MSESVVDLTYRGLPLGRRIKLTQIRPSTGYLELPAPMPVGTRIAIATDDGVGIEAVVTGVHEQVAGSERTPGMIVAPVLEGGGAAAWWEERVALPDLDSPSDPRARPGMVLPRTPVVEGSPPAQLEEMARAAGPASEAPASATAASAEASAPAEMPASASAPAEMSASAPAEAPVVASAQTEAPVAASASAEDPAEASAADDSPAADPEMLAGAEADAPLVDDGKKTIMMQSIDLRSLGLESGASGQFAASSGDEAGGDGDGDGEGDGDGDGGAGANGGGEPTAAASSTESGGTPSAPVGTSGKQPSGKKRKKRR